MEPKNVSPAELNLLKIQTQFLGFHLKVRGVTYEANPIECDMYGKFSDNHGIIWGFNLGTYYIIYYIYISLMIAVSSLTDSM
jgi:hypothetical protein